jgi:hypothetical protein
VLPSAEFASGKYDTSGIPGWGGGAAQPARVAKERL